jgi:cytochrome c biogenesis protein CcmG/thiol:disulfide interchange protein DsbE
MSLRRLLFFLPVVLFVAVGIGLALGLTRDPSVLPSALIDKEVPAFDLPPLEGAGVPGFSSEDLRGEVSLVNVFASWCVPCRVEHPIFVRLAEQGVPIYGINYKDQPAKARAWLDELGNPFRAIGADEDGQVAIDWGVYGVPETFVVDREGRIRHRHVGPVQARDLERVILPMVAELSE